MEDKSGKSAKNLTYSLDNSCGHCGECSGLGATSSLSRVGLALEVNSWLAALHTIIVSLLLPGLYAVAIVYFSILMQNFYGVQFPITASLMLAPFLIYCFKVRQERDENNPLLKSTSHYLSPEEFADRVNDLVKTANNSEKDNE